MQVGQVCQGKAMERGRQIGYRYSVAIHLNDVSFDENRITAEQSGRSATAEGKLQEGSSSHGAII